MGLLARAKVIPHNAQVELSDLNATDYPQWQTGNEAAVALPDCVAVATQGDQAGKVVVEIWYGELQVDDPALREPIFEGEFVTTENSVVVGNTVGNEFHSASLPAGRYHLRVFTSPVGAPPARVYFLLSS